MNSIRFTFCGTFEEKLQEKREEEEQQQTIPSNSDLHIYDDQVAISIETRSKDNQVYPSNQARVFYKQSMFAFRRRSFHENISCVRAMQQ